MFQAFRVEARTPGPFDIVQPGLPSRYLLQISHHVPPTAEGHPPSEESGTEKVTSGPNPNKHDFPNFTHICKILLQMYKMSYKVVKNESYQMFTNISRPILEVFFEKLTQNFNVFSGASFWRATS
jgi:hypothetical protein